MSPFHPQESVQLIISPIDLRGVEMNFSVRHKKQELFPLLCLFQMKIIYHFAVFFRLDKNQMNNNIVCFSRKKVHLTKEKN